MKRIMANALVAIGLVLVLYFAFVLYVFSSSDNPLLLPFVAEPTLVSIVCIALGCILLVLGLWWRSGTRREASTEAH
jgi:protein-S-isoprenylcysteine O-methyltransferase Ste14